VLIGRNNEEASVYGAEFEFRNNILENELKRLSININASYIISELTMSDQEYEGRKVNEPERDINRVRQLQGQSPYLINAGLSYNLFDKDLEAGAYYNVQGKALQVIGIGQFPDVYTEPFHSLNINVSKRFGEKKNTTVSLKVDNLLNDVIESRFDYFGNTEFLFSSLKPGVNTTLGVSFKF
jgi:outer membrane receptor protein involved in Fe transport